MKAKPILIAAGGLVTVLALSSFGMQGKGTTQGYRIRQINLVDSLPRHAIKRYGKRRLSQIKYIVVHHSAAKGKNAQYYAAYHINKRGWPGIGYHFVIERDGTIKQTNLLTTVSYHVKGYNTASIGISLSGNFEEQKPTPAQLAALIHLIKTLKRKISPALQVKGHRELRPTLCPGKHVDMKHIRTLTQLRQSA